MLAKDLFLELMSGDNSAGSYSWTPLYTHRVELLQDAQSAVEEARGARAVNFEGMKNIIVLFSLGENKHTWELPHFPKSIAKARAIVTLARVEPTLWLHVFDRASADRLAGRMPGSTSWLSMKRRAPWFFASATRRTC